MSAAAGEPVRVALVLVSHSRQLAEGAAALAGQMAPAVALVAAGGDDGGGLGTSFASVERAIAEATEAGRSALVLADLGSAVLTAESVLDLADDDVVARVRIADAPFVEGAVAAAVTANGGADLAEVLAAAEGAAATFRGAARPPATPSPTPTAAMAPTPSGASGSALPDRAGGPGEAPRIGAVRGGLVRTVTLRNPLGLHARPAAVLARLMAGFDARVTVSGVNAASVLELMKLGVTGGQELTVRADGPQAEAALDALVEAVEGGFGEL